MSAPTETSSALVAMSRLLEADGITLTVLAGVVDALVAATDAVSILRRIPVGLASVDTVAARDDALDAFDEAVDRLGGLL